MEADWIERDRLSLTPLIRQGESNHMRLESHSRNAPNLKENFLK
jgi:hypothetical protein